MGRCRLRHRRRGLNMKFIGSDAGDPAGPGSTSEVATWPGPYKHAPERVQSAFRPPVKHAQLVANRSFGQLGTGMCRDV